MYVYIYIYEHVRLLCRNRISPQKQKPAVDKQSGASTGEGDANQHTSIHTSQRSRETAQVQETESESVRHSLGKRVVCAPGTIQTEGV